jgi:hypothetical protein
MNFDLISQVKYVRHPSGKGETLIVFDGETESLGKQTKNEAIELANKAGVKLNNGKKSQ